VLRCVVAATAVGRRRWIKAWFAWVARLRYLHYQKGYRSSDPRDNQIPMGRGVSGVGTTHWRAGPRWMSTNSGTMCWCDLARLRLISSCCSGTTIGSLLQNTDAALLSPGMAHFLPCVGALERYERTSYVKEDSKSFFRPLCAHERKPKSVSCKSYN
jgi:hypothetical protein